MGQICVRIDTAWQHAFERAGISRYIMPYDLRHGFATQLITNDADIRTVAALMGHKSPAMVLEHYQHVLNRQKREAVASLPTMPECVQSNVCKN
ncbi:MAG: tyrosine-type recombinase/integrase [Desulfovibrio sp.]|nr:tyrosine-type recombinase/integrase [Desulfovibrio sp.]